ncbi:MAG: helix-turn-helix domain-containing protein [Clostridiales bacterium]|nr:helix-turn-helix domain-containing protein [Clostridiales bacterium]
MNLMEIGSRIKLARKSKKLTQEQLAELVNVSSHYIYEIEQGRKTMSLDTLEKISSELHISLDYLFWGDSVSDTEDCSDSAATRFDQKIDKLSDTEKSAVAEILSEIAIYIQK